MPFTLPTEVSIDVICLLDMEAREALSLTSAHYNAIYRVHFAPFAPNILIESLGIDLRDELIDCTLRVKKSTAIPRYFTTEFGPYGGMTTHTDYRIMLSAMDLTQNCASNLGLRLLSGGRLRANTGINVQCSPAHIPRYYSLLLAWRRIWELMAIQFGCSNIDILWERDRQRLNTDYLELQPALSAKLGLSIGTLELVPTTSSELFFLNAVDFLRTTTAGRELDYFHFNIGISTEREIGENVLQHMRAFVRYMKLMFTSLTCVVYWKVIVYWQSSTTKVSDSKKIDCKSSSSFDQNPTTNQRLRCRLNVYNPHDKRTITSISCTIESLKE